MKKFLSLSLPLLFLSFFLTSCQQNTTMDNSAANKATMMKVYEAFNTGNTDSLDKYVAEDIVDHQMDTMITKKQGIAGLKETIGFMRSAFPDLNFIVKAMATSGDTLLAYITFSGTNTGMMMGMPPTNKSFSIDGADVVIFKDGKLAEHWGVEDDLGMMKQLGLMPPPPMDMKKDMKPDNMNKKKVPVKEMKDLPMKKDTKPDKKTKESE